MPMALEIGFRTDPQGTAIIRAHRGRTPNRRSISRDGPNAVVRLHATLYAAEGSKHSDTKVLILWSDIWGDDHNILGRMETGASMLSSSDRAHRRGPNISLGPEEGGPNRGNALRRGRAAPARGQGLNI